MFLIIFCFLSISLGIYAQQIPEIKINPFNRVTGDLKLSDLVETIEYIPLETTNKCLVGVAPRTFDISDNYIVLHCWKTNQVYLFKRNGSFVGLIGREGSGPGEYVGMSVSSVFIDEEKKQIFVGTTHPNQISIFDLKGNFIKNYVVGNKDEVADFMYYFNKQFLLAYSNSGTVSHKYELRTSQMHLLTKGVKTIPFSMKNTFLGVQPPSVYLYEGELCARETCLNDTLFAIKNNQFSPKYIINSGKYDLTPELRSDGDEYRKYWLSLVRYVNVFESNNYLFFDYLFNRNWYFVYYSKQEKKILYFNSQRMLPDNYIGGIPNDYDGGLPLWPTKQSENTWYVFQDASDLCEETPKQKRLKPKGPEKAIQAFKRMCKKMQPDDNPVLMIVKLKK